ncbi:MAG: hypothetical protein ABIG61_07215 [Planctomycetota bacterium]
METKTDYGINAVLNGAKCIKCGHVVLDCGLDHHTAYYKRNGAFWHIFCRNFHDYQLDNKATAEDRNTDEMVRLFVLKAI